jgi:hypothetical protein
MKTFGVPGTFVDDPEAMIRPSKQVSKAAVKASQEGGNSRKQKMGTQKEQFLRFLDFPADICQQIYDYLFQYLVLVINKNSIREKQANTSTHTTIPRTCRFIFKEALPVPVPHTKQVHRTPYRKIVRVAHGVFWPPRWGIRMPYQRYVQEI